MGRDEAGIGRLIGGDGLRAACMLALFAYHVFLVAGPFGVGTVEAGDYGLLQPVAEHLDLGLAVFFVLSGYLISRPFARAYVTGGPRPSVRHYLSNRALRILPAFWVVAGLVVLRFGTDGGQQTIFGPQAPGGSSAGEVLAIFGFAQTYFPSAATFPMAQAWSLDAEMAFYLVVPLAGLLAFAAGARVGGARTRATLALGVLGVLLVASTWFRTRASGSGVLIASPPAVLYAFVPGVMLAVAEPHGAAWLRARAGQARLVVWLCAAVATACAVGYAATPAAGDPNLYSVLGRRAALAAGFGGTVLAGLMALQLAAGRAPRLLDNRAMRWMGERSYSFYLIHIAVLLQVLLWAGDGLSRGAYLAILTVVGLPATIALSALSYRFVEQPFLARRRTVTAAAAVLPAQEPPLGALIPPAPPPAAARAPAS